jgi:hypothetical protein
MLFSPVSRPVLLAAALLVAGAAAGAPQPPPGFNVHLVHENARGRFWRGGAPRRETLDALAAGARKRGVTVTLVDLRTPPNRDDQSGKGGRLSPKDEAALAQKLGMRYLPLSALDRKLGAQLKEAVARGDVYMHCMYGVNRTGFATARFARAEDLKVSTEGLGRRDWKQGDTFQSQLGRGR